MIEKRLLQRKTFSTRWVAASHRSRWQRWAEALAGRWGRYLEATSIGLSLVRRSPARLSVLSVQQRVDVNVALAAAFQLATLRSTLMQPSFLRVERHERDLRRVPRRAPRLERVAASRVAPPAPAALRGVEQLVRRVVESRLERQLMTRLTAQRLLVRSHASADVARRARVERRDGAALDELPKRLLRRAERQLPEGPPAVPARFAAARPALVPALAHVSESSPMPPLRGFPARDAVRQDVMGQAPVLNIERIAEQVIDRLDRRITAQRERMGRV